MIAEALRDAPKRHFGCAYADPAWAYKTFNAVTAPHRSKDEPYKVMSLDDMKALPVGEVMARDSVLIMWVIGSHLDQALELGRAWGFTYSTDAFYWVKVGKHDPEKRPISLGHWTRKQVEMALLFTRGKPSRLDKGIRQLIEADDHTIFEAKREHSRKPDCAYERVEKLVDGPYLELFSRNQRPGWTCMGDELGKFEPALVAPSRSIVLDNEVLDMIG